MSNPNLEKSENFLKFNQISALWKFSRPHTIIGTTLSVCGLALMAFALTKNAQFVSIPTYLLSVLIGWFACICGNIYIVGLNQLEDVEIDLINKPHLPLASGEFSRFQGQFIVGITGVIAIVLAVLGGPFLLGTVGISLLLGTAYSLPPIRLKRFPFWAAFCIFTVRGVIVNLGLFLHFQWLLQFKGKTWGLFPEIIISNSSLRLLPLEIWVLTLFVLGFTLTIALLKDIPDIEGDRTYNINTFTVRLGGKTVFNFSLIVLTLCYLGIAVAGVFLLPSVNRVMLGSSHLLLMGFMLGKSQQVDIEDKSAIAGFYQFIWKLFFLEYIIFPITCL
jgi:homogentisate phytyltransferase / homogentisate geranylgeranyltransferase